MGENVYKIIELTGTSRTNIEAAIQNALERANQSVRNMRWFEVIETRGHIEDERISYWQVTIKVGFDVEGSGQKEKKTKEQPAKEANKKQQDKEDKKMEKEQAKDEGKNKSSSKDKYRCIVCGYVYDPAEGDPTAGIAKGTSFEDLPDDWKCPECGVGKGQFEKV